MTTKDFLKILEQKIKQHKKSLAHDKKYYDCQFEFPLKVRIDELEGIIELVKLREENESLKR